MQVRRSALAGEAEATEAKLPGLELLFGLGSGCFGVPGNGNLTVWALDYFFGFS